MYACTVYIFHNGSMRRKKLLVCCVPSAERIRICTIAPPTVGQVAVKHYHEDCVNVTRVEVRVGEKDALNIGIC